MLYEVYLAMIKKEIVYIGSGRAGIRHKHITSGISHNYMLNKIHFTKPDSIKVMILHSNLTQDRSLELELELIKEYQPVFNSVGTKSLNNKFEQQYYYEELLKKDKLK